ncbi:hypothetical protein HDV05_005236 [Chytridiales sp. JEL 0842]|nr:hypothetical protein HDV05_005236 [Chytridiales sp. JEL 0842]
MSRLPTDILIHILTLAPPNGLQELKAWFGLTSKTAYQTLWTPAQIAKYLVKNYQLDGALAALMNSARLLHPDVFERVLHLLLERGATLKKGNSQCSGDRDWLKANLMSLVGQKQGSENDYTTMARLLYERLESVRNADVEVASWIFELEPKDAKGLEPLMIYTPWDATTRSEAIVKGIEREFGNYVCNLIISELQARKAIKNSHITSNVARRQLN